MSYIHAMLACSEVRMIVRRNVIVDGNYRATLVLALIFSFINRMLWGLTTTRPAWDPRKNSNVVRLLILVGNLFCGTRSVKFRKN